MNLTARNADIIREWNARLTASPAVRLLKTADNRTRQFQEFAGALTKLAPKIKLITERGNGHPPAFLLEKSWRYHLVPQGAELEPFLELLEIIARDKTDLPASIINSLNTIQSASRIKIYVTSYCPHCRRMVNLIKPLPIINPLLQITFIDGQLFPEMAKEDKIQSVPTVICNEQFRWTGQMRLEELIQVMTQRDPGFFGKEIFKGMIKNGSADKLAEMMLAKDQIFPAFLETLIDPEWPVRLGAMVVFEQITDRNPKLAKKTLQPLWEKLSTAKDNVKGDMIYLFGNTGDEKWIPRLEGFKSLEYPETLREAAEEAIEALKDKR
jgi:glutaredoxin